MKKIYSTPFFKKDYLSPDLTVMEIEVQAILMGSINDDSHDDEDGGGLWGD